jgi:hypothetical protein
MKTEAEKPFEALLISNFVGVLIASHIDIVPASVWRKRGNRMILKSCCYARRIVVG